MRWIDLDRDAGLGAIPSNDLKRTKAQKINGQSHGGPFARQALAWLKEVPSLAGDRKQLMSKAAVNTALLKSFE